MICPFPPPITGESFLAERFEVYLKSEGCHVERLNLASGRLASGLFTLRRLANILAVVWKAALAAPKVDRVYLFPAESVLGNYRDLFLYAALGSNLGKLIVHLHGGSGFKKLFRARHRRLLNNWFLKRVRALVVEGGFAAEIFQRNCPTEKLTVIQNYAPAEYEAIDSPLFKKRYAQSGEFKIVFLGNLLEEKGWRDLATSFFLLPAELRQRTSIDFIGGYSGHVTDSEIAELTSVSVGRLRFHGPRVGKNKTDILVNAHVLALPSYYDYEGQPVAILEGYAAGCAVVATLHAGIPDIFIDGVNGVAVPMRSPECIARALISLAKSADELAATAQRNIALSRTRFVENLVNQKILSLIKK